MDGNRPDARIAMSETDTHRRFPGLMRFLRISEYRKNKKHTDWCAFVLAGAEGLEPSARGFGVARSQFLQTSRGVK